MGVGWGCFCMLQYELTVVSMAQYSDTGQVQSASL